MVRDSASCFGGAIPEVGVIFPAYNEVERGLEATLLAAQAYLGANYARHELIVVDDGSTDETAACAQDLGVCVISQRNQGKGAAVQTGMLTANAAVRAFTDADGACPIEDLDQLMRSVTTETPVVIGKRTENTQGLLRAFGHSGMHFLTEAILPFGVADTQCGAKAFTAEAAETLFQSLQNPGFSFDVEVLWNARQRGWKIGELPVAYNNPAEGSKVHAIRDGLKLLGAVGSLGWQYRRDQVTQPFRAHKSAPQAAKFS